MIKVVQIIFKQFRLSNSHVFYSFAHNGRHDRKKTYLMLAYHLIRIAI